MFFIVPTVAKKPEIKQSHPFHVTPDEVLSLPYPSMRTDPAVVESCTHHLEKTAKSCNFATGKPTTKK